MPEDKENSTFNPSELTTDLPKWAMALWVISGIAFVAFNLWAVFCHSPLQP